jgi:hypothetical protein
VKNAQKRLGAKTASLPSVRAIDGKPKPGEPTETQANLFSNEPLKIGDEVFKTV